jgi:hypothetical protein
LDWQLVETATVAVLSLWVYLFSPSDISRGVAVIMFVLNILWVLVERELSPARHRARDTASSGTERVPPPRQRANEPTARPPERPRVI